MSVTEHTEKINIREGDMVSYMLDQCKETRPALVVKVEGRYNEKVSLTVFIDGICDRAKDSNIPATGLVTTIWKHQCRQGTTPGTWNFYKE